MTARPIPVTPPDHGSAAAGYVSGIVRYAEHRGVPRPTLFRALGFPVGALDDPAARLPLDAPIRTLRTAAAWLGEPAFAMSFGEHVACAELTLASPLAAFAREGAPLPTPRQVLDTLNRYAPLGLDFGSASPASRFVFEPGIEGVWLEDRRPCNADDPWGELTESIFARMATGMRRRGGPHVIRGVDVVHARPGHADEYQRFFGPHVRFSARRNALCFDPAFLDQPLEPTAQPVGIALEAAAEAQLQRLNDERTWSGRVRAEWQRHLADGDAGIESVCRALAVSRQTLYRRLQDEGTTYATLLDQHRHEVADQLLANDTLTLGAIAARLAFSEPAAFSRAYKRWTGRAPRR